MDSITLSKFRCFRDKQTARLAPLTLLVGENSTVKTSLMAPIRVLWDVAYWYRIPDFKADPFDLGSFDEVAHYRVKRSGRIEALVRVEESIQRSRSKISRPGTSDCWEEAICVESRRDVRWNDWKPSGRVVAR